MDVVDAVGTAVRLYAVSGGGWTDWLADLVKRDIVQPGELTTKERSDLSHRLLDGHRLASGACLR
jgi:hypothetical protein